MGGNLAKYQTSPLIRSNPTAETTVYYVSLYVGNIKKEKWLSHTGHHSVHQLTWKWWLRGYRWKVPCTGWVNNNFSCFKSAYYLRVTTHMNPPFLFLMHAGENNFLCFSFWKHIPSFWEKWDWKETIFFWLVKTCLVGILVRSCPRLNGNLQYREKGISSVKVLSHPRRHIFHIESINIFSEMGVVPELTSTLG